MRARILNQRKQIVELGYYPIVITISSSLTGQMYGDSFQAIKGIFRHVIPTSSQELPAFNSLATDDCDAELLAGADYFGFASANACFSAMNMIWDLVVAGRDEDARVASQNLKGTLSLCVNHKLSAASRF